MKRYLSVYLLIPLTLFISCIFHSYPRENLLELSYQIIDSSNVTISWRNYLSGIESFTLEKKVEDGEFVILSNFDNNISSTTDTVTINKEYQYRCYASIGDSIVYYSNIISVLILEDFYKSFSLFAELIDSTTIRLSWEEEYDNDVGYIIEWSVANRSFRTHDGILASQSDSVYIDNLVSPYVNYRYRMYATLNGRSLPYSNIVSITPEGQLEPTDIDLEMIFVEGDTFQMGDFLNEGYPEEKPPHNVLVDNFYISKYEVTQEQFTVIMNDKPGLSQYSPDNPAGYIRFHDALEFCNRLSDIKGYNPVYTLDTNYFYSDINYKISVSWDTTKNGYRLPTEAEWEYAARSGGREDRKWSGTNLENALGQFAWYNLNSDYDPKVIGSKKPNELGIYDMSGSALEWCWDGYSSSYYSSSPFKNPRGYPSGTCSYRTLRGGSYRDSSFDLRNARRHHKGVTLNDDRENGFRVCRNGD